MDLTDEQWAIIEPLTPEEERIPKPRRGQPRRLPRDVRNGILGILPSDAPWKDVPARYPPSQTYHWRFQRWVQIDGGHGGDPVSAGQGPERARGTGPRRMVHRWHLCGDKKGGLGVGTTTRGNGAKRIAMADGAGRPLSISITRARPHEVTLVETTLEASCASDLPRRLLGDRADDRDRLGRRLAERGIEMIAPLVLATETDRELVGGICAHSCNAGTKSRHCSCVFLAIFGNGKICSLKNRRVGFDSNYHFCCDDLAPRPPTTNLKRFGFSDFSGKCHHGLYA
ncbi:MAG: hypothetical protein C0184_16770 [Chloroflexus aggregans]|uniref:Insertion element IS402-like domain-containing protein n=1 Tax=Chloroflexus aggregans TaxID=152260 RepID=A0A2J6WRF8_9CHLR|nr:MAG: hypothetical protein C0184_16770 [Chloroflexus aggregans]